MSKNSAKKNYQSLMEWIVTLKRTPSVELKEQPSGKFSKADYYKKQGA
jgi:hypothetical protein